MNELKHKQTLATPNKLTRLAHLRGYFPSLYSHSFLESFQNRKLFTGHKEHPKQEIQVKKKINQKQKHE